MRSRTKFAPAALLALGCVLLLSVQAQRSMALQAPLSQLPDPLPGFERVDLEVPDDQVQVAGMTSYVNRVFRRDSADVYGLYVGFYDDGTLKGFAVDLSNPDGIYFLDKGYAAAFWDPLLRALFVLDGTTIKQWDAGAAMMTATFVGKVNRQVAVTEAEWVEVVAEGTPNVKVRIDGVQRLDSALSIGEHRMPNGAAGRDYQLEVSTSASVAGVPSA